MQAGEDIIKIPYKIDTGSETQHHAAVYIQNIV